MSGIAGVVRFDGGPADPELVRAMTAAMAHRGPDGISHWAGGSVALGHALLATTPEAEVEELPLEDASSRCVVTADARIDNREELIRALGLADMQRVIGDGELILRAYLRWGMHCPTHLLGDFAFAVWDPRCRRLFCARDHMGMRQLVYGRAEGMPFLFATEPMAVAACDRSRFHLSRERIADYLDDLEYIDKTSTFFAGVRRLPPGHWLALDEAGLETRCYWRPRCERPLRLPSDAAYAAAFLDVFTEAVRCRLRSNGPVGATLSGGMDSTAAVAVAARLLAETGEGPLRTFSAVGPDPRSCIETRSVKTALRVPGIEPRLVSHADLSALLPDLVERWRRMEEPFDGRMVLVNAVYACAARAGTKVVLDGVGSDVVLTPGDQMRMFIRTGQWRRALRDARGARAFCGEYVPPPWRAMLRAIGRAYVPERLRRARRSARAWLAERRAPACMGLVGRELAEQVDLRRRRAEARRGDGDLAAWATGRARDVLGCKLTVGRERYDRIAAAAGVEARDPFVDPRVVTFCLALPEDQLQSDGWPKIILRRAMEGLVPDPIRWRLGRQHLGWTFTQRLFEDWGEWRGTDMRDLVEIGCAPDALDELESCMARNGTVSARSAQLIWLRIWLQNVKEFSTVEEGDVW